MLDHGHTSQRIHAVGDRDLLDRSAAHPGDHRRRHAGFWPRHRTTGKTLPTRSIRSSISRTFLLQYSQTAILIFNRVLWPHVTMATLTLSAGSPAEQALWFRTTSSRTLARMRDATECPFSPSAYLAGSPTAISSITAAHAVVEVRIIGCGQDLPVATRAVCLCIATLTTVLVATMMSISAAELAAPG